MTKAELLKSLRGYKDDVQVVIEVEDDAYAEVVAVSKLTLLGGPWRKTAAIVLQISDPLSEDE